MRSMHLLFAILSPALMISMLSARMGAGWALGTALFLSLWPVHFFYHFLYYTDPPATFWVLLMCRLVDDGPLFPTSKAGQQASSSCSMMAPTPPSRPRVALAAIAGTVAILCRQNNVVWVLFALGTSMLAYLQQTKEFREESLRSLNVTQVVRFIICIFRNWKQLLWNFWPMLLPILGFLVFLKYNGSVVLGDKSNHVTVFHVAQLGYFFSLYASLWGLWSYDSILSKESMKTLWRSCFSSLWRTFLSIGTVCTVGILLHFYTLDHPFLLADNRHYTFYLWNRFLGNPKFPWLKSLMAIPYGYAGFFTFQRIGMVRSPLWLLIYFVATSLVLVPAHLLEPRYFTVPLFIGMLNSPQLSGRSLCIGIAAVALVNFATLYIFISRPFVWVDGSEARFSW